jgi:hypothetical protein
VCDAFFRNKTKMSAENSGGLNEKLAKMDVTLQSSVKNNIYQVAWSIENFPVLMENFQRGAVIEHDLGKIRLAAMGTPSLHLECWPNDYPIGNKQNQKNIEWRKDFILLKKHLAFVDLE